MPTEKPNVLLIMLKPEGYMTAQIGKSHLGDRNEFLPTVHGFDEFQGISPALRPFASIVPKPAQPFASAGSATVSAVVSPVSPVVSPVFSPV